MFRVALTKIFEQHHNRITYEISDNFFYFKYYLINVIFKKITILDFDLKGGKLGLSFKSK